ncbi:hypothetical protein [Chitinophaga sp.]|uniref:hypothetical protein n=1 Tax=Chitinophaga sp. TaxID=1869181 RepID=UPI002F92DDEE
MYLIKAGCLLIAFFSFHRPIFSQDRNTIILKDIHDKYQEINANRSNYRKVWAEPSAETTEGGEVIGYFFKDSIRLIEQSMYAESGKSETSIYYDKGNPVFIFLRESSYNVPFFDSAYNSSLTKVTEDKTYFYQGKMIRWIDAKKQVFSARDKIYIENEEGALDFAKELYNKVMAADIRKKVPPPASSKTK